MECQCCFEDLILSNKVFYRINNEKEWMLSNYCKNCVLYLQNKSWGIFQDQVKEADCKKALQKILEVGPPINIRDKNGFPNPLDPTKLTEIDELKINDEIKTAKLTGSFTGKQRTDYITFLENFKFT
tara:strand:+ start:572 stop:952 length:381 start_codon:yes stop_codon:yes gene_type:complete